MNYEQKYKEALEKGRKIHRFSSNPTVIKNMEEIFPELRESEDEKIRKGLIKGLSAMRDIHKHQTFSDDAINIDDAIAWLEKQGEQKPAEWTYHDEVHRDAAIRYLESIKSPHDTAYQMKEEVIDWLKSIKPQNHWKPSEEQMEALVRCLYEDIHQDKELYAKIESLYNDLKNL